MLSLLFSLVFVAEIESRPCSCGAHTLTLNYVPSILPNVFCVTALHLALTCKSLL
jgi:hypothetical protein